MLRTRPLYGWLFALLATVSCAGAAAASDARVDLPVAQMVLPNGDVRYFVPITVGDGAPLDAELDTGSFGLRVLKAALKPEQYRATEAFRRYVFGGGARFNGVLAEAKLSVGAARTDKPMLFQVIESADCAERMPDCPASRVKPEDYRIAGDGYPGKGFQAILGISMRQAPMAQAADNPLMQTGDAAWIVLLPRPGSSKPGHLIVNPTAKDREDFTTIQLERQGRGWADTALPGCLVEEQSEERYCGKTMIDSGAPGIAADSDKANGPVAWPAGRAAKLEIGDPAKRLTISFSTGAEWSNRVRIRPPRDREVRRVVMGTLPYFHYAVLYDAKAGTIGFKRRETNEP